MKEHGRKWREYQMPYDKKSDRLIQPDSVIRYPGRSTTAGEKLELASGRKVYTCVLCGSMMEERHCKVVCPSCGYFMDCSDLF